MSQSRRDGEVKVNIVMHPPQVPERPWIQDLLMACRRCGAQMVRGTQCERCKAWCR